MKEIRLFVLYDFDDFALNHSEINEGTFEAIFFVPSHVKYSDEKLEHLCREYLEEYFEVQDDYESRYQYIANKLCELGLEPIQYNTIGTFGC